MQIQTSTFLRWLRYLILMAFAVLIALTVFTVLAQSARATQLQGRTLAAHVAFDAQGQLWRVLERNGFIWVDVSADLGKTFSKPVQVNPSSFKTEPTQIAQPKITLGNDGNLYLAWTAVIQRSKSVCVWFARSTDGGKSFEEPISLYQTDQQALREMEVLQVSDSAGAGAAIAVVWVSKLATNSDESVGASSASATLFYAVSENQGRSFAPVQKLADTSCADCRVAISHKPDGTIVALWLAQVDGEAHDYKITELHTRTAHSPVIRRASFSHMQLNNGNSSEAALAVGGEGKAWWGYHMAWFERVSKSSGTEAKLLYSRMDGEAWVSSPTKKIGLRHSPVAHPVLFSTGEAVWLIWCELGVQKNSVVGVTSIDGGRSWGEVQELAASAESGGIPQVLKNNAHVYLVWSSEQENIQVIILQ